jgi:nicotinic acid mononucleotide adenylyltransferase
MIYVFAVLAFAVLAFAVLIYLFSHYKKYKKRKASEEEARRFEICEIYLEAIRKHGINSDHAYAIKSFSDAKTLDLLKKIDQIKRGF